MNLLIGTRGSLLAVSQAEWVIERITKFFPTARIEICIIKTLGDRLPDHELYKVRSKGVFVRDIEQQLLSKKIDLAVHSLKDLPTELPKGLHVGAIPPREKPFDALISRYGNPLAKLARGAAVGTGSPRRARQILAFRSDLKILPLRGNLDTRIKKVRDGEVEAAVVALAGLRRLGRDREAAEIISAGIIMPAPGQGALAVESRRGEFGEILDTLNDEDSFLEVLAERAFLEGLGGGCQTPIGALARVKEKRLLLRGIVADPNSSKIFRAEREGKKHHAKKIGTRLAKDMLKQGVAEIISPK